jgi:trehalose/maltose hydrolase-like predicted phosphorylase
MNGFDDEWCAHYDASMRITLRTSALPLLFLGTALSAPIPKLVTRHFAGTFVPASLSNGFIGIRPGANPLIAITSLPPALIAGIRRSPEDPHPRGNRPLATVVAGFVRSQPVYGVETWAPAPYPLAIDLRANRVSMQTLPDSVQVLSQSLDMSNGELETEMTFTGGAVKVGVRVIQFASRSVPSLLCQRVLLTPSADTALEIETRIDTTDIPGTIYRDHAPARNYHEEEETDRVMGFRSDRSKLGIALAVPASPGVVRRATGSYSIGAKAGQTYAFDVIAAMVSEVYHPDPDLQAIRLARWGKLLGWDELRRQNQEIWAELWKSRIEIAGDPDDQRALDTAFFYLHANSHPASRTAVPSYGFSQYDINFGGHILWDMDSYIFPAVLLTWPPTAKAMLEFRLRGLDAARKKAASFGYQGAQFPWEAASDGTEACWPVYDMGGVEVHIVPDVALAFWEYQTATQDPEFLRRGTWPVLQAVAEWIASRGHFTARGYEIDHVMGPDESLGAVTNGTYTNAMCKLVMRGAIECARRVGVVPPEVWERIEREIVIPLDAQRKVVIPYDGATPGRYYSVGMLQDIFMHGMPVPLELFRNTFEFEEAYRLNPSTVAWNPCGPNATAFGCPSFAAAAAFFGDRHKAAELFRHSWQPYWIEPYGLTKEYPFFVDGNGVTNHGALLMAALMGFTGLRITDGDWAQYPATLPEGWSRITLDRVWIKGKPMKVVAENGKRADITEIKE